MSLQQVFAILWARRNIFWAAFLTTLLVAALLVLVLPRHYSAEADLLVEATNTDPVTGQNIGIPNVRGFIATQSSVITSDRVAREVVKRLKLDQAPRWRQAAGGATGEDAITMIGKALVPNLEIKQLGFSNILSLTFTNDTPQDAANIANAFADVYQDVNLRIKVETSARQAKSYEGQVAQLRAVLATARQKLSDEQKRSGIVNIDEQLDAETAKLKILAEQSVGLAVSNRGGSNGVYPNSVPLDPLQTSGVLHAQTALADVEAKLSTTARELGPNHPDYAALQAERAARQRELSTQLAHARQVVAQLKADVRGDRGQGQLEYEAQKAKILNLKFERDRLALLQQDVARAKADFDAAASRENKLKLGSNVQNTSVELVSMAIPNPTPSSPKVRVIIIAALGFGLALGIACAVLVELFDRRVRSGDDIQSITGLDVLGVIPSSTRVAPTSWLTRMTDRLLRRSSIGLPALASS